MPGEDYHPSPFALLQAELARMRRFNLTAAIDDVDKVIELLEAARDQITHGPDPMEFSTGENSQPFQADAHTISMAMTRLQNPVKERFDAITNDLKDVTKAQKAFGKALDKAMPLRDLPMETDAMAQYPDLVNRAIGMHLLREGQFSVASAFFDEAQSLSRDAVFQGSPFHDPHPVLDNRGVSLQPGESLHESFAIMYDILAELKNRNLVPAIDWAYKNGHKLEAKGSNLEFELSKLQFIWLFKLAAEAGPRSGTEPEFEYARQYFARFQRRHLKEIAQLSASMVYASNLEASPYRHLFSTEAAFEEVALTFTREFCSLLGLSAESPLYIAVTAGSIALPRLIKYTNYKKERNTEWTTENELAFETPLPKSMVYHPIFVCPISKEQTTEGNPPMMLICGHVVSRESLQGIAKGMKYKCPYCPQEGVVAEAKRIVL